MREETLCVCVLSVCVKCLPPFDTGEKRRESGEGRVDERERGEGGWHIIKDVIERDWSTM